MLRLGVWSQCPVISIASLSGADNPVFGASVKVPGVGATGIRYIPVYDMYLSVAKQVDNVGSDT